MMKSQKYVCLGSILILPIIIISLLVGSGFAQDTSILPDTQVQQGELENFKPNLTDEDEVEAEEVQFIYEAPNGSDVTNDVNLTSRTRGFSSDDEIIRTLDVQVLSDCLLGWGSCEGCDLNGDGWHTIIDLQLLIDTISAF